MGIKNALGYRLYLFYELWFCFTRGVRLHTLIACRHCGKEPTKRQGCPQSCRQGVFFEEDIYGRPGLWLRRVIRAIQAEVFGYPCLG
ncbi:MAG: hypothetical protein WC675_01665 [Patescibacteria group bacterium]|jgi:hypothetical protein